MPTHITPKERVRRYALVGLGCLISAAGINAFFVPNKLLSGGINGIAMFTYFLYGWPIGLVSVILNIPLFIVAYKFLDREYTLGALYGLLIFSAVIDSTSYLTAHAVVDDVLLASIYGGIVVGVGAGIVFRAGGSSGGLDIVAAIMKKYYGYNMGMAGFAVNAVIMCVAGLLFGAKLAMYTLISMFVGASVTDKVIEGFNRQKTVMIISDYSEKMAAGILTEIGRGVTILNGEGAYTHSSKKVILVVVTRTQVPKIKSIAEKIDPNAFMVVNDAAEVMGRGFTMPVAKKE